MKIKNSCDEIEIILFLHSKNCFYIFVNIYINVIGVNPFAH